MLGEGIVGWLRSRRRTMVFGVVTCCTLLVVAGCNGGTPGKTSGGDQTLLVNNNFCSCTTLDPQRVNVGAASAMYINALYSTLVTYKGSDITKLQPNLAQSWNASSDQTTFTFTLRSDAKFSDGSPVTPTDVIFTLKRFANIKGPLSSYVKLKDVVADGTDKVVITTPSATPSLPQLLSSPYLGILNSKLVQANGGSAATDAATSDNSKSFFTNSAAGGGPYSLESYDPTSKIVLVANPNYWGGKPAFNKVIMSNVPAATQLLNIQKDSHEIAMDISPSQAGQIDTSHASANIVPAPVTFYVQLSQDKSTSPATANAQIAQAVRTGIDYKFLLSIAGPGSVQAPSIIPPNVAGALPSSENATYDPAAAKSLVAAAKAAGVDPSFTLSFPTGYATQGVSFQQVAEAVAANLSSIGISVKLDGAPVSTWVAALVAGKTQSDVSSWPLQFPDPAAYAGFNPGGALALRAHWQAGSNPDLDSKIASAFATSDPAARNSAYQQIQRMSNQAGAFIPLFYPSFVIAYTKDLVQVNFNPNVQYDFASIAPAS